MEVKQRKGKRMQLSRFHRLVLLSALCFAVVLALAPGAFASSRRIAATTSGTQLTSADSFAVAPTITLTPAAGAPGSSLKVSGSNFGSNEAVDIYFDTTDEALASTNPTGSFSGIRIPVPTSAVPGTHWVTGVGRQSGLSAQSPFKVQTNWAQFRDLPNHTGFNSTENVLSTSNVSNMDVSWSAGTGGAIDSSPAVFNGTVYVGSYNGSLYAFNALNGTQLWSAATSNIIYTSSPAVANSVVYIGSLDGNLYAFNTRTGTQLWSAATYSPIDSSPAVANGVVYVGSEGDYYSFYAFNAQTGAQLWSAAIGYVNSSPAVANGVVYVGSLDGSFYAFNAQTGAQLWSVFGSFYPDLSSAAVANGVVYIGSTDGTLHALNAQNGTQLWSVSTGNSIESSPAVANGVIYVGSEDGNLYAFNAQTGTQLWSAATGSSIQSSPAVANGVVYIGSQNGSLYAFNAQTGAQLWSSTTGGAINSSPAVVNGMVYVGSDDNHLYAYALPRAKQPNPPAQPNPASLHPDLNLHPQS